MSKIGLITKREYISRVKKKSFIIITILGPILMAGMFIVPIWLATQKDNDEKTIAIIDNSGKFKTSIDETEYLKINFLDSLINPDDVKIIAKEADYYAVLFIPENIENEKITLYSYKQPSVDVTGYLKKSLESEIERQNLEAQNIDLKILEAAKRDVEIDVYKWTEKGEAEKSSTEIVMAIGFIAAILIYMFIFMYGAQVMRGVMEEKTSRIVEVIISSVKPFQLMMGKIMGIALVALTQFIVWIVFTAAIIMVVQPLIIPADMMKQNMEITQNLSTNQTVTTMTGNSELSDIMSALGNLNYGLLIFCFLFYFLGGYLLYSSLFAAIGGAVDNEADTQQFMLPLTIPLILAFVMAQAIIVNPDGQVAFWFSIIPFTSPVIMLIRVAFGVPEAVTYWELALSMILLVLTFLGTTWIAAKIYRTGILMYGKKVTYKELWKWLRYKS
jgi:ABC-2 type transport system permease protein